MSYIVKYRVRDRIFWIRDESSPNTPAFATEFETLEQACEQADIVREDVIGRTGRRPGFEFVRLEPSRHLPRS